MVYSLGSDGDLSFDMVAAHIGCEVHTFDPSLANGYASSPAFASVKARFDITLHEVGIGPVTQPPAMQPGDGVPARGAVRGPDAAVPMRVADDDAGRRDANDRVRQDRHLQDGHRGGRVGGAPLARRAG